MRKKKKKATDILKLCIKVVIGFLLVVMLVFLGKSAYSFGVAIFSAEAMEKEPGRDVVVIIPEGASSMQVASILTKKELSPNKYLAFIQLKLSKFSKRISPGQYILNTSMEPDQLFEAMSKEEDSEQESGEG